MRAAAARATAACRGCASARLRREGTSSLAILPEPAAYGVARRVR